MLLQQIEVLECVSSSDIAKSFRFTVFSEARIFESVNLLSVS